jgi:hypothetical protein
MIDGEGRERRVPRQCRQNALIDGDGQASKGRPASYLPFVSMTRRSLAPEVADWRAIDQTHQPRNAEKRDVSARPSRRAMMPAAIAPAPSPRAQSAGGASRPPTGRRPSKASKMNQGSSGREEVTRARMTSWDDPVTKRRPAGRGRTGAPPDPSAVPRDPPSRRHGRFPIATRRRVLVGGSLQLYQS